LVKSTQLSTTQLNNNLAEENNSTMTPQLEKTKIGEPSTITLEALGTITIETAP
jgi:hypothetical protein